MSFDDSCSAEINYKPLPIRNVNVTADLREDGSWILESAYRLPAPERSLIHLFIKRARRFPDRGFIARREVLPSGGRGDWHVLSYAHALGRAKAIAQALIDFGCGPGGSVMALSGPSVEHAIFMLGAHMARAAYAPISTSYSLNSNDFDLLRHTFEVCRPKLIFADDGAAFERALGALDLQGVHVITVSPPAILLTIPYGALLKTEPTDAVTYSIEAICPDTHAKTIFTSGSTGKPKGVIHTHGMLAATVAQLEAVFSDDDEAEPAPHLSWLPWNHLGGTNASFCAVIRQGATLYIDEGRPVSGKVQESLRNLRELSVTEFNSPPIMFSYIIDEMERSTDFRDHFFKNLKYMTYGTASLSKDVLVRLQSLAVGATGSRIPITTRYGSTEAQGITIAPWPLEETGPIGNPSASVTLKLAPRGELYEIRVKGPCVTPGYLNDPRRTAEVFDEEGFLCTGDAARLVDTSNPSRGLWFEGRIAENFKLSSGTWVAVGQLRIAVMAALGIVRDCLIAGLDRDDVRALVWLRQEDAALLANLPHDASALQIASAPQVLKHLSDCLSWYNEAVGSSSRRIARLMIMLEPPVGSEITDKGYINQAVALRRREALVKELYGSATPMVIHQT